MSKILYFVTDMDPVSIKLALGHKNKEEVGICLLQDAVYYACKGKNELYAEAIKSGINIFATKKDVTRRGIQKLLYPKVKILDYNEIIDLVLQYNHIINI